jgi:hypothetical protein
MQGQAHFVRARIVGVGYAVPVGIGATIGRRWARLMRAGVALVQSTVSVLVTLALNRAALSPDHTYFIRAGIVRVWDAVSVSVGATARGTEPA